MIDTELKSYLLDFGYNIEDINKIINAYPFVDLKEETKLNHIKSINNFLLDLNYTKEEIIISSTIFPNIYTYDIETLKNKIKGLISLGYKSKDAYAIDKYIKIERNRGKALDDIIDEFESNPYIMDEI